MNAYYNENDPYAAQWLRNLIAAGHIAPGEVDERSIVDVRADDLRGFTQCHFFAGIGVWSHALRLAGWPDDQPVWTGSCPCQPFSAAGKGQADEDDRHLAPTWLRLIGECRPSIILGEQVGAAIRVGWLDALFTEMESMHYACGAVDFPACSVGAPHIRQRIYFVADAASSGRGPAPEQPIAARNRIQERSGDGVARDLGDSGESGREGDEQRAPRNGDGDGKETHGSTRESGGPLNGFWRDADWLPCIDGKARPVEPGTFPLAHGATARVGRLRAYGNCIVPQAAAAFVQAFLEGRP